MSYKDYTWDWLLNTMIAEFTILDYYQLCLADTRSDLLLYRLGRNRGVILDEVHMIKRTSEKCYRITSFKNFKIYYTSFNSAYQVCVYMQTFVKDIQKLDKDAPDILVDNYYSATKED